MSPRERNSLVRSVENRPEGTLVVIAGKIDFEVSNEFQKDLLDIARRKPKRLVLELSGVDFMDSSGVASLVKLLSTAKNQKIDLRLAGLQERIRNVLTITHLDKVFDIRDTVDEAWE